MNPTNEPEVPVVAYCRVCGKGLTETEKRVAQGTVYCADHLPTTESPWTAPAPPPPPPGASAGSGQANGVSPGLAFVLGFIPGVGAIYNGQYAKGIVHVLILGLLISIMSSGEAHGGLEPLFGLTTTAFFFYMAFEAYHTARKRQRGEVVDEFSSIMPLKGQPGRLPVGPVLMIVLGVLFLLNNLDLLRIVHLVKYWPVALIALGVYMLYARMADPGDRPAAPPASLTGEVSHERN